MFVLMIMVVVFILVSGMRIFSSKREHLLSALLSLEYMSMGVYLLFLFMLSSFVLLFGLYYLHCLWSGLSSFYLSNNKTYSWGWLF